MHNVMRMLPNATQLVLRQAHASLLVKRILASRGRFQTLIPLGCGVWCAGCGLWGTAEQIAIPNSTVARIDRHTTRAMPDFRKQRWQRLRSASGNRRRCPCFARRARTALECSLFATELGIIWVVQNGAPCHNSKVAGGGIVVWAWQAC